MTARPAAPSRAHPRVANLGIALAVLASCCRCCCRRRRRHRRPPRSSRPTPTRSSRRRRPARPLPSTAAARAQGRPGPAGVPRRPPADRESDAHADHAGRPWRSPQDQVKRCVGPPPLRQIEDPQSPPCIAYCKGDNGGATAKGVTRDSIYIAVPTPENSQAQYTALVNFFNNRFQFYGRKLVLEFCRRSGGGSGSSDQANQVADAALAAAGCGGSRQAVRLDLLPAEQRRLLHARRWAAATRRSSWARTRPTTRSSSTGARPTSTSTRWWRTSSSPTSASGSATGSPVQAGALRRGQRRLHAAQAAHHPAAQVRHPARAVHRRRPGRPHAMPLDPMIARLRACGVDVPSKRHHRQPGDAERFDPASAQNAMLQLKDARRHEHHLHVQLLLLRHPAARRRANAYQPEWITSTFGLNDVNSSFILGAGPTDQLQPHLRPHLPAADGQPAREPLQRRACRRATPPPRRTPRPPVRRSSRSTARCCCWPPASRWPVPTSTSETFRDGLRKTVFPNPLTSLMAGDVDVQAGRLQPDRRRRRVVVQHDVRRSVHRQRRQPGAPSATSTAASATSSAAWPRGDGTFFNNACDSGG